MTTPAKKLEQEAQEHLMPLDEAVRVMKKLEEQLTKEDTDDGHERTQS